MSVTVPQVALAAQEVGWPDSVTPEIVEYVMLLTAVCPVLLTVQLMVAAVGEVVVAPPEQLKANAAGVSVGGPTVMLTDVDAAVPAFGVAVRVPE